MIFKKMILAIICFFSLIQPKNQKGDIDKYLKLKNNNARSIKKSDLPCEFCEKAFEIVNEFIGKTMDLDYEILIYFDYIEGEIIKCKIGSNTGVDLKINDNEFKGQHIASIHNHTKDMYSPPSDKNFGIFSREWEDYELIAGHDGLWILKGKFTNKKLTLELKLDSMILFQIASEHASLKYQNQKDIEDECDILYGKLLSNFINDKHLNNIQLEKKEYCYDRKNH